MPDSLSVYIKAYNPCRFVDDLKKDHLLVELQCILYVHLFGNWDFLFENYDSKTMWFGQTLYILHRQRFAF